MPAAYSKIVYCKRKETFENNLDIFEKYGSFIHKSKNSDRVLKILKPQFGNHQKSDLRRYAAKIVNEQEKNMGSIFDDYKDLLEFCPNDSSLIASLLLQTWQYNRKADSETEPLAIFMPLQ